MPFGNFENLKGKVLQPPKDAAHLAKMSFQRMLGKQQDEKSLVKYDELDEVYSEEDDPEKKSKPAFKCSCCRCNCAKRYLIAILSSVGFILSFGIRCNLGVAILKMTKNESVDLDGDGTIRKNESEPEFSWTPETVGVVDSSFFWGYIVTQVPGGYLASRLPANRLFGMAIGLSACLNMLLPAAAKVHYGLVISVRILQGLVEGVTYPSCHGIWRHWAPPLERSMLATISFCGSYAGAVLGMPLSAVLTEYLGWQSGFYVFGVLGALWSIVWWFFSFERPGVHPTITEEERIYIETSIGENTSIINKNHKTPWLKFFTSMPVYAIMVANFCRSWTFYLLIISQPTYFLKVFGFEIDKSGTLSALPHLVMAVIVPIGGSLLTFYVVGFSQLLLLGRSSTAECGMIVFLNAAVLVTWCTNLVTFLLTSKNGADEVFIAGFGMEAVFLLGVGFTRDTATSIVCLTLAVGFSGFAISGFNVNHLDIAPRYASILMGLSNSVGTLSGMLCPIVVQYVTKGQDKSPAEAAQEWQTVFLIASIIHFCGVVFYAIFASGEKQPWAEPPAEETWRPEHTLTDDGNAWKYQTYGSTTHGYEGEVNTACNGGPVPPPYSPVYETKEQLVQKEQRDRYMADGNERDF